jgi:hypothetical protein
MGMLGAAMLLVPHGAAAQQRDTAVLWQEMTRADVEAAYRLLFEDHPGSVPAAGDAAFRQALQHAHATALERAPQVKSIDGYRATMRGFATMMGDKHIWSAMKVRSVTVDWPGFLVGRRGSDWVVGYADKEPGGGPATGDRLISCDGVAAERLAEQRLGGFRAIWSVDAQRTAAAPWLMVDDGNPFLRRPARCLFDAGGGRREILLDWRTIDPSDLTKVFDRVVPVGAPGFGLRQVGAGHWIALQSLTDKAVPVVEAVRAQAAEMRKASFVVLDLRGNGGGDSTYGDEIARLLTGEAPPPAEDVPGCTVVWRATDRAIRQVRVYEERNIRLGRQEAAQSLGKTREAMEAALAAGRDFSGPTTCGDATGQAETKPVAFPQRVILLTDHSCFSSCLLVTDLFRRKGALHVGEATDAATRYFEVREDEMPSGLSGFSTLQALSAGSLPQIGPFVPAIRYEGDISDTAALEQWVQTLPLTRRRARAAVADRRR